VASRHVPEADAAKLGCASDYRICAFIAFSVAACAARFNQVIWLDDDR
jgi:hypothetical protein